MLTMQIKTVFTVAALVAASAASADPVLECRDNQLQSMTAQQLRDELSAAGARNCEVRPAAWGESVACQGTQPGARAFGLPVREFSAEVQNDTGKRSIQIVTTSGTARSEQAVDTASAAAGLELAVESEETGVTVISCIAQGQTPDPGKAADSVASSTFEP